nr:histidine kinase [Variovorax paradoxus]
MIDALARSFTPENLKDVARHGLTTAVFCCVIAVALAASGRGGWVSQLIYSLSIGMTSWLVIDIGRLLMAGRSDKRWPMGLPGILLVLGGAAIGFLGGNAIGDAWTGKPMLEFRTFGPDKFASTLMITLVATIAICYYYYSRGKAKYLEGQIALAERDATDARLKLIETQLEPHMLFNTLANLRALITTDPQRAVAMLDRLNSYLRVTLSGSRSLAHPLAAEFQRLGDYLELMSVRMGARLAYRLDLPDDLRELPVPPLLLQPLVENAIRHGLEPQVQGGEITVGARREGLRLLIDVCDTGVGIDKARAPSEDGGFGLAQVRERLATVYGPQGSLSLSALPTGGTCATITLPLPA